MYYSAAWPSRKIKNLENLEMSYTEGSWSKPILVGSGVLCTYIFKREGLVGEMTLLINVCCASLGLKGQVGRTSWLMRLARYRGSGFDKKPCFSEWRGQHPVANPGLYRLSYTHTHTCVHTITQHAYVGGGDDSKVLTNELLALNSFLLKRKRAGEIGCG